MLVLVFLLVFTAIRISNGWSSSHEQHDEIKLPWSKPCDTCWPNFSIFKILRPSIKRKNSSPTGRWICLNKRHRMINKKRRIPFNSDSKSSTLLFSQRNYSFHVISCSTPNNFHIKSLYDCFDSLQIPYTSESFSSQNHIVHALSCSEKSDTSKVIQFSKYHVLLELLSLRIFSRKLAHGWKI